MELHIFRAWLRLRTFYFLEEKKMKKTLLVLSTILLLIALAVGMTVSASADDVIQSGTWGNLTWELNQTTGELTISGTGAINNFSSSSTKAWRKYSNYINSVTISNGVTSIGDYAFYKHSSLTSITIPDSVTNIGNYTFYGCMELTSITIPNSVKNIGERAFYKCSSLIRVSIPDSVRNIGEWAFRDCLGLTSITIPEGIKSIEVGMLYGCQSLKSFMIPESVTSIGNYAFECCDSLKSITIPDSVTSIGEWVFCDCSGLTSITISNNVTSIGESAFRGCSSLTSITIPDSVTNIGKWAFQDCTRLSSITIPNSVTSIGYGAFYNCEGLSSIMVQDGNAKYHSTENCLIETNSKTLIAGCKNSVIPTNGSVTSIGEGAFYGCDDLESITIPSSVTSIGYEAFRYCSSLMSITIANSVTNIDNYAFNECTSLTNITIPEGVTSIGDEAFSCCTGLTSITIPNSMTSIGYRVFYYCNSLLQIVYCGTTDEWNTISKRYSWDENTGNYTITYHHYQHKKIDDETHGDICYYCGNIAESSQHQWNNGEITTPATHIATGIKTFTCTDCSTTKTEEVAKIEHTYGNWTKKDDAQHQKECACGDVQTADHNWNSGEITTQPTCLTTGVKTFTCSDCNATKTEEVAKLTVHTYDNDQDASCNVCGDTREIVTEQITEQQTTENQSTKAPDGSDGKKSGCGSSLAGGMAMLLLLVATMGGTLLRKRKIQL